MKNFLLILWQLPQVLLGIIVVVISRAKLDKKGIYRTKMSFGVSLGPIIVIHEGYGEYTERHECGHSKQSLMLGPLYLLIVGIPSLIMNIMSRISFVWGSGKFGGQYYSRWPESWANKLGEIEKDR